MHLRLSKIPKGSFYLFMRALSIFQWFLSWYLILLFVKIWSALIA
ncbi:hypothetical protein [Moraxella lacunata]